MRKKEKMQVTSIFSFSHNVLDPIKDEKIIFFKYFYFCRLQMLSIWTSLKILSLGKELTLFQSYHGNCSLVYAFPWCHCCKTWLLQCPFPRGITSWSTQPFWNRIRIFGLTDLTLYPSNLVEHFSLSNSRHTKCDLSHDNRPFVTLIKRY